MSQLPPEVLIHILKHLHSPRDLYHSLLVSRSWCECSVELLWHRPSFTRLSTLVKMMRVLSRGDQTFTYARFIRRLNFLFLGADLTDALFSRLAQCDRLERLTLVNCNSISDDALARVLPCLPNLVAIDLTAVSETSDKVIIGLAMAARRLQGINLTGCKQVTDRGVLALAAHCPLLRRVKLSGVEQVTDTPVSALAKSCPLLLEIDLNNCKHITDKSVRDLWTYSAHMREMRLSQCVELTDAAFPAPLKSDAVSRPNPFPASSTKHTEEFPPLIIPKPLEHLRMLDLTACSLITDDAVDGIISHAPKIRNLVLSKCQQLTDRTVENICLLGKHLHYLHLGHATSITDRSIKNLARCCTRLRYVDFANCVLLTDMSVFELSSLPKLRRIGLVRVSNLTDEAIYALAERHSTLERIHLSYCDQISVMAIHFLLQKLHKLTHLSLTGIPSFRKPELQQFCRQPPQEFNMSQRLAFCVYSGNGVAKLRAYLTDLFNTITEDMNADDDETEYDDDFEDGFVDGAPDAEMETGNEGDLDEDFMHDGTFHFQSTPQPSALRGHRPETIVTHISQHPELAIQRDQTVRPHVNATSSATFSPIQQIILGNPGDTQPPSNVAQRRSRGFGHQPVVESSTSPTPSDVPSNRSTGTAQSNGAGFFRTYEDIASSSRSNGALTPDYIYAEIGHGRGAGNNANHLNALPQNFARHSFVSTGAFNGAGPSAQGITQVMHSANPSLDLRSSHSSSRDRGSAGDSQVYRASSHSEDSVPWPHMQHELPSPSSRPPMSRDLHDSVHAALGPEADGREPGGRGRSVKRSLRNTFNAAEHYATSFLFGRATASTSEVNVGNGWVNGSGGSSGSGNQSR
ncbi:RNI-like protein [Leucogyrophana mollusca]|uniref:RNI-like protein n=1 Tax=Leucogyrophana mollusca TaxID=85980 RepID=A0ACB8C055_9AGAM|nr:RNI-like protein [Leucogyrophana mollusca]